MFAKYNFYEKKDPSSLFCASTRMFFCCCFSLYSKHAPSTRFYSISTNRSTVATIDSMVAGVSNGADVN